MIAQLKKIHHFALHQALYPLVLSSFLASALFAGRVFFSGGWTYVFLVWNLFLAWIPFLASLVAAAIYRFHPKRWWSLLMPGLIWFLFFPNAPYLVTDFLHLRPRSGAPIWYDIVLLSTFAWSGLFLAVFSLRTMQTVVRALTGSIASWFFVAGIVSLSGFGVYMGRFLRWNSWDLFFHPYAVLADITTRLANPLHYPRTYAVTLIFALFLLVCYLTITTNPFQEQS